MALEIKSPPVLEGQVALDFYRRWRKATESKSKEEVQESMRRSREFLAKYYNPYKLYKNINCKERNERSLFFANFAYPL